MVAGNNHRVRHFRNVVSFERVGRESRDFSFALNGSRGIVGAQVEHGRGHAAQKEVVQNFTTVIVADIFHQFGVPRAIYYLSPDIQGDQCYWSMHFSWDEAYSRVQIMPFEVTLRVWRIATSGARDRETHLFGSRMITEEKGGSGTNMLKTH